MVSFAKFKRLLLFQEAKTPRASLLPPLPIFLAEKEMTILLELWKCSTCNGERVYGFAPNGKNPMPTTGIYDYGALLDCRTCLRDTVHRWEKKVKLEWFDYVDRHGTYHQTRA